MNTSRHHHGHDGHGHGPGSSTGVTCEESHRTPTKPLTPTNQPLMALTPTFFLKKNKYKINKGIRIHSGFGFLFLPNSPIRGFGFPFSVFCLGRSDTCSGRTRSGFLSSYHARPPSMRHARGINRVSAHLSASAYSQTPHHTRQASTEFCFALWR